MPRRIGPAAALALLALAGCGGDGSPDATPAPTTTSPAPTAAGTPSGSAPPSTPSPSWPAGCPSPGAVPAGATVVGATVAGGRVTTERPQYDVKLGSAVRLVVTTDTADEVHVHSYDVTAETRPGCPAVVDLQARVPGSVEVELERSHLLLFKLRAR